jgi:hypothetical protein
MKKILVAVLLAAVVLPACTKYKEGPMISLRSRKARLAGHWKVETVTYNGTDITSSFNSLNPGYQLDILKSGRYGVQVTGGGGDYGSWTLGEDGDDITFKSETSQPEHSCRILRLLNKELWWKQTETNGDVIETHYKQ